MEKHAMKLPGHTVIALMLTPEKAWRSADIYSAERW